MSNSFQLELDNLLKKATISETNTTFLNPAIYGAGSYIRPDEIDYDICLYDEVESATHDLICDYAKIAGVYLNKDDPGDYHMPAEIRDIIISYIEQEFNVQFPACM